MPDPMMVRLAVSTPDSLPLNSGSTQVIVQPNLISSSAANNSYVHQTDSPVAQPATTTPPAQVSVSPTQQIAQGIPPGVIPLNQMSPHHMPPPFHVPHSGSNGAHIHDHSNGHHHNGLYLGPAYANEFYPAGAEAPPHGAYFIPQEMCPAHTQLCAVHPSEYGPVTVPMVSQSGSPPIPMPVQVPPGHVMQQIVDENGTLRHVILSTQHQQLQAGVQGVQHHIHGHYNFAGAFNNTFYTKETSSSNITERITMLLTASFLATLIFLACAGNILVCVAIYTERSLRRIGNLFLASLAIADLFVSLLVMTFASVNDILGYWCFSAEFCDTWIAFDVMCSTSSILNLCAISLDRYIHIRDPLRYTRWVTRFVAVATIGAIWILAAFVSFVPISLGLHRPNEPLIIEIRDGKEYPTCALDLTPTYALVSSCISFYVPCIVLVGIYCRLYCYAQKHVRSIRAVTRTGHDDPQLRIPPQPSRRFGKKNFIKRSPHQLASHQAYNTSDRKAAVTVGVIMGVFLVCWMPFFCVNIVAAFCKTCIGETTFKILSWLGYSNSAFNPIIYSIFNTEFRKAFKRILLKRQWPKLLCCGSFQNDYYVNTSNDSKFITNYDGRLHSTTDVEQLSAI